MAEHDSENLLRLCVESGRINLSELEELYEMNERKKYLEMHSHSKWRGADGKWNTYLPNETAPKHRKRISRKTEKELDDVIINYWKQKENNPTVEEVFTEWNDRKVDLKKIQPSTHTRNKQVFRRFYGEMGKRKIKSVSTDEWEDFLCECIVEYSLTAKDFSNLKGITKNFLKRAKKRKMIDFDVESFFGELDVSDSDFRKPVVDDSQEIFYDDEMEKLMNYIRNNPEPKNIGIALMFVTGIRIGELVALKHEDFDGTTFFIKREETKYQDKDTGKYVYCINNFPKTPAGYRSVYVPESQNWILDKIKLMNPFGEFILTRKNGERMRTFDIRDRQRLLCKHLGIKPKSPHKIRKTYASILLDNGVDEKLIERQMGHTSILCTEKHYHRDRKRKDEKQEIFNNIPQLKAK